MNNTIKTSLKNSLYTAQNIAKHKSKIPMRLPAFRGSGLPICNRLYVLSHILMKTSNKALCSPSASPYRDYFLEEGTLIHKLLQRWLGLAGVLYGRWGCQNPNCKDYVGTLVKENRLPEPRLNSGFCCGLPRDYIEFEIKYKGFSGHIDGILYTKNLWILCDFKTSNKAGNDIIEIPDNYFHQLNSYYYYVIKNLKKLNIPRIDKTSIFFVPRDYYFLNPSKWTIQDIIPDKSLWVRDFNNFKASEKCLKKKSLKLFKEFDIPDKELCSNKYETCWLIDVCHSDKEKELVKNMFKEFKGRK